MIETLVAFGIFLVIISLFDRSWCIHRGRDCDRCYDTKCMHRNEKVD